MNTQFSVFDHIPNPDHIGAAEYRAIYDVLTDGPECMNDPAMAMAVCSEFKHWAQTIIDKLEKAVLEEAQ